MPCMLSSMAVPSSLGKSVGQRGGLHALYIMYRQKAFISRKPGPRHFSAAAPTIWGIKRVSHAFALLTVSLVSSRLLLASSSYSLTRDIAKSKIYKLSRRLARRWWAHACTTKLTIEIARSKLREYEASLYYHGTIHRWHLQCKRILTLHAHKFSTLINIQAAFVIVLPY